MFACVGYMHCKVCHFAQPVAGAVGKERKAPLYYSSLEMPGLRKQNVDIRTWPSIYKPGWGRSYTAACSSKITEIPPGKLLWVANPMGIDDINYT